MHSNARFSAIVAVLVTVSALPAVADEGRTPLYEPTTLTMPGSYVVTRNIVSTTGPALTIVTEGVTVDLNGFEIRGLDLASPVILFNPPIAEADHGDPHFQLHGGTVIGGLYGLQAPGNQRRNVSLQHMQFGDAADAAVRVHNVGSFHANMVTVVESLVGFDLMCPTAQPPEPCGPATMTGLNVHASRGVQCSGVSCSVTSSSFTSLGGAIRLVDAPNSEAKDNSVFICPTCFNPQPEPPAMGAHVVRSPNFHFEGNTFQGDPTSNGSHHGIVFDSMSPFGRVADNIVSMFGDDGIRVMSDHTVVQNNLVGGVGGNGIVVDGMNNFVEGNKLSGCGAFGIDFLGGDHVYRGNILLGNDGGAVQLPAFGGSIRDAGGNEE